MAFTFSLVLEIDDFKEIINVFMSASNVLNNMEEKLEDVPICIIFIFFYFIFLLYVNCFIMECF